MLATRLKLPAPQATFQSTLFEETLHDHDPPSRKPFNHPALAALAALAAFRPGNRSPIDGEQVFAIEALGMTVHIRQAISA